MRKDVVSNYLNRLDEETMSRAWGDVSHEERRRIVTAALIFGEQFEKRMNEYPPGEGEDESQRFLMPLFGAVVSEFAEREDMDRYEATDFLSNLGTRDRVLELDEVLGTYESDESGRTLDELLNEAVESRQDRAVWSRHFRSG